MIIQCEQCHTKFRLDDSKVTDKGVKVRCAKCKHVFTVVKEQSAPPTDFEAILNSAPASSDDVPTSPESSAPDMSFPTEQETTPVHDVPEQSFQFDAAMFIAPPDVSVTPSITVPADNEFSLASLDESSAFSKEAAPDDIDFGAFDFGSISDAADKTVIATAPDLGDKTMIYAPPVSSPVVPSSPVAEQDSFGGLDFSGDNMFGEVVPPAPEETEISSSFDFRMDGFAESMGMDDSTSDQKASQVAPEPAETPFNLGEIDFGDELSSVAVQQVNPDELKPTQELLFAPLADNKPVPAPTLAETTLRADAAQPAPPQEELPPLSIASRRKQGPLTGILAVLGVVVIGIAAFFGYSLLRDDKGSSTQENGRISIRNVGASYVMNKNIGELLVIKGEAVNEFSKPRASIKIKGMIYGAQGQVISSKNAFCGNPLSAEQLADMPLEKIEAAMANQFGDSLANMEVVPGKALPFVIVIAKPAADAKDYGVESAGSTVATAGK